jgi:hypothetical protein
VPVLVGARPIRASLRRVGRWERLIEVPFVP